MSTDEAKGQGIRQEEEGVQRAGLPPFHEGVTGRFSRVEVLDAGITRYDPETAHKAIGDEGYERRIPESCLYCEATREAEAAEVEARRQKEALDG